MLAVPPGTDEAEYERAGYVEAMREANSGVYGVAGNRLPASPGPGRRGQPSG